MRCHPWTHFHYLAQTLMSHNNWSQDFKGFIACGFTTLSLKDPHNLWSVSVTERPFCSCHRKTSMSGVIGGTCTQWRHQGGPVTWVHLPLPVGGSAPPLAPSQKKKMTKISRHFRQTFRFLPPQNHIFPPRCPHKKFWCDAATACTSLWYRPIVPPGV